MQKLEIIYEDKNIIVLNKPANLLTISNATSQKTLYSLVSDYVKKQHKSNKIFIVHRLDKDTSGLVVMAKSKVIKEALQASWANTKREYIALVLGKLVPKVGEIKQYLEEDKWHFVHVVNKNKGSLAITNYEVLKYLKKTTLVKINILTGKKHQIRVAFSYLKHPIVGDKKYGLKENSLKRLALHASLLEFNLLGKKYHFDASLPKEIVNYLKKEEF